MIGKTLLYVYLALPILLAVVFTIWSVIRMRRTTRWPIPQKLLRPPGESLRKKQEKIEDGLERPRVLVLCMSANAFGLDWAQLEAGTFRFRDPLNHERRFIPLRLDNAPFKGPLAQFLYINWRPTTCEQKPPQAERSLCLSSGAL